MQHGNGRGNPAFPFLGKGIPQRFQVDFHNLIEMNLEPFPGTFPRYS